MVRIAILSSEWNLIGFEKGGDRFCKVINVGFSVDVHWALDSARVHLFTKRASILMKYKWVRGLPSGFCEL